MASQDQSTEHTTICVVTETIIPDPTKCLCDLSKIPTANPNLVGKENKHFITLWNQEVGEVNSLLSLMIREFSKLKMATLKV